MKLHHKLSKDRRRWKGGPKRSGRESRWVAEAPPMQRDEDLRADPPVRLGEPRTLECLRCGVQLQADRFTFVCDLCRSSNFRVLQLGGAHTH